MVGAAYRSCVQPFLQGLRRKPVPSLGSGSWDRPLPEAAGKGRRLAPLLGCHAAGDEAGTGAHPAQAGVRQCGHGRVVMGFPRLQPALSSPELDALCPSQVSTGNLLVILSRHYQDVSCLQFTGDSSHFISGGKDCLVLAWSLCR